MDVDTVNEAVAAAGDRIAKAQAAEKAMADVRGVRIAPRAADAAAEEPAAAEVVTPARKAPRKKRGKKSPEVLFPAAAEPAAEEAGLVPLFGFGRFLGRFA
jgi:hypothetical protein